MNKKQKLLSVVCALGFIGGTALWVKSPKVSSSKNLTDEALLALIKNDRSAFEHFISAGGNLQDALPAIDGKVYTVAEGISHFERDQFAKYLHQSKMSYLHQKPLADFDIMTLAILKNNPSLLEQLILEKPNFDLSYGKNGWSLLHLASAHCSHKLTEILHQKGKLNWNLKAKDGSTPLTLAAQNDCLPMLSYWKEQKADFKEKNGKGLSALSILRQKKDAALMAFAASFEERLPAAVAQVAKIPNFYKKRKIPKDQVVDFSAMIEPEERPLEATETAEFSEFAD